MITLYYFYNFIYQMMVTFIMIQHLTISNDYVILTIYISVDGRNPAPVGKYR